MSSVAQHMRELALPAIFEAVRAHRMQGCDIPEGAEQRALEAAIKSLKSEEKFCIEPDDE